MLYFHTRDSLTVVKVGCIDQILLFKKEKKWNWALLRFSCLQFENCVNAVFCLFFFFDVQVLILVMTSVLQSIGLFMHLSVL